MHVSYWSNEKAALALAGGGCSLSSVAKLPGMHVGAHLVRRTVDMSALKTASYSLTHPGAPPFLEAQNVPADSYKTVTDVWQGFHMIPLHEDSRQLAKCVPHVCPTISHR